MGDEFQTPLICNCFNNIGLCFMVYFLPCIPMGQALEEQGVCGCFPAAAGIAAGFFTGFLCVPIYYASLIRANTRERYNIDGSHIKDLLCSFICFECSLLQSLNEKATREGGHMGQTIERV